MYTISIHHKEDKEPTSYTIRTKNEADIDEIDYTYWKDAIVGEYALSDDNYVAKVLNKREYPGNRGYNNIYLRFPWGYTFYNTQYPTKKLKVKGRVTNGTFTGRPYQEVKSKSKNGKYRSLAMTFAQSMNPDLAIDMAFGSVSWDERKRWRRVTKTENFKNMVKEELEQLLHDRGLTEKYTLQLLEDVITLAKDKKDVSNLLKCVDNLQDMHGMKDKNVIKTTERIEASSNISMIDELREHEEKKIKLERTTIEQTDDTEHNDKSTKSISDKSVEEPSDTEPWEAA